MIAGPELGIIGGGGEAKDSGGVWRQAERASGGVLDGQSGQETNMPRVSDDELFYTLDPLIRNCLI